MFCNCSKKFNGSKGNLCLHQSQLFLGVARGIVLEFLFFILWTFIWPVIWILCVRVTRNGFSWQSLISLLWIMGSAVHKFSSVFANCCGFCWQTSNARTWMWSDLYVFATPYQVTLASYFFTHKYTLKINEWKEGELDYVSAIAVFPSLPCTRFSLQLWFLVRIQKLLKVLTQMSW